MRVLIATGIFPPDIGGVASAMASLREELRAMGHEVSIIAYGDHDAAEGVTWVSRAGGAMVRYLRFLRIVRKALTPDTIVLTTDVFSAGIPTRLALIGRRNRFVVRLGGEWRWESAVESGRFLGTLRNFWKRRRGVRDHLEIANYRWILGRAWRICVTSRLLEEVLAPVLKDTGRFVVTANRAPAMANISRVEHPHELRRFIYIGRFAWVKNVGLLATIFSTLAKEGVPFHLTLIGSGETEPVVRARLEGIQGIEFFGALPHAASMTRLAEADVLLLPSFSDICPNVVLEALALGVPAVVTSEHGLARPIGGVRELPPDDPDAWIAALRRLATDDVAYRQLQEGIQMYPVEQGVSLVNVLTTFFAT